MNVIEYIDETEYFNIKAQTDRQAVNGKNTNLRYWEGGDRQGTGQFTDDEI